MLKYFLSVVVFVFVIVDFASAQQIADTVLVLQQVNVSSTRINAINETSTVQMLDTSIARLTATTLAEQLTREGGLFIKSYGPGGLSTLSLRGSSAAQTAVLWNGINICSPMLGLFDLGLIPTFLIDETKIQYGGAGAELGSGAIGGAIHLDSKSHYEKGTEIQALSGGGSFGFYEGGFGISSSENKFHTNSKIYFQGARNNFKFKNFDGDVITQPNAKTQQIGFTQDLSYGTADNFIGLHEWYLKNEREIPPHMLTTGSEQKQDDEVIRIVSEWYRKINFWTFNLHNGWSKESLNYMDPAAKIEDLSTSYLFQNDMKITYHQYIPLIISAQFSWLHNEAIEKSYGSKQKLNQEDITLSANYHLLRLNFYLTLKQGFYNETLLPILPSFSSLWNINNHLSLKGNIARVYRVPTLNDLYWRPGGNSDLKPEEGFTESISMEWKNEMKKNSISFDVGCFNTKTKDEIVWLPQSNGLYHAENINEIWSRGIESTLKVNYNYKEIFFHGFITPHYTIATITKTDVSLIEATNNELSYTPKILLKASLGIQYRKWAINYYHDFTGERFTSIDNSESLAPYATGEINISFDKRINKSLIHIFFSAKNIWNEEYQVIAYRAMPGRSFQAGILINLK